MEPQADDLALAQDLLDRMAKNGADFTLVFRGLCEAAADPAADEGLRALFAEPAAFDDWAARWRSRLTADSGTRGARAALMRANNPAYIPRNHLVEEMIQAAVKDGNFAPFETLLSVLAKPFEDQPDTDRFKAPPRPDQIVHRTFCGT